MFLICWEEYIYVSVLKLILMKLIRVFLVDGLFDFLIYFGIFLYNITNILSHPKAILSWCLSVEYYLWYFSVNMHIFIFYLFLENFIVFTCLPPSLEDLSSPSHPTLYPIFVLVLNHQVHFLPHILVAFY